jgi:hypothetical protein
MQPTIPAASFNTHSSYLVGAGVHISSLQSTELNVCPNLPKLLCHTGVGSIPTASESEDYLPHTWVSSSEQGGVNMETFEAFMDRALLPHIAKT